MIPTITARYPRRASSHCRGPQGQASHVDAGVRWLVGGRASLSIMVGGDAGLQPLSAAARTDGKTITHVGGSAGQIAKA